MSYVIRCRGLALGGAAPVGEYLESYDPDANNGRGSASWTPDPARALRFADAASAWELWRRPSRVRPLRTDGRPNRPLTAFTVEIAELDEPTVPEDGPGATP